MGKPKKTERSLGKHMMLPERLVARTELELWSELEGKVPFGAWQELMVKLLTQHWHKVDRIRKREAADLVGVGVQGIVTYDEEGA